MPHLHEKFEAKNSLIIRKVSLILRVRIFTVIFRNSLKHNGHKPKPPQSITVTKHKGHKVKRPQTIMATNQNGHINIRIENYK